MYADFECIQKKKEHTGFTNTVITNTHEARSFLVPWLNILVFQKTYLQSYLTNLTFIEERTLQRYS